MAKMTAQMSVSPDDAVDGRARLELDDRGRGEMEALAR